MPIGFTGIPTDMIDAVVPQSTVVSISGHRTISVFLRYALSSDD
jgi:hypothetical protein